MTSSKSYLINALYQWIIDNQLSPYLLINANDKGVMVPEEYVRHGEIILNISPKACKKLDITTEQVTFVASFNGIIYDIELPMHAILAIYSHENGRGMSFTDEIFDELKGDQSPSGRKGLKSKETVVLTSVKPASEDEKNIRSFKSDVSSKKHTQDAGESERGKRPKLHIVKSEDP
jgi:stringent starvation protein B